MKDYDKALEGKTLSNDGILPDDNAAVRQLVSQLEIYDQVWTACDLAHAVQNVSRLRL